MYRTASPVSWARAARRLAISSALLSWSASAQVSDEAPPRRIAPEIFPSFPTTATPSPAVSLPTADRPLGVCVAGERSYLSCLRATTDLVDAALDQFPERLRPQAGGQQAWLQHRRFVGGVAEAQRRYRALRDYECQQLPAFEPGAAGDATYESRLICMITRGTARLRELEDRYRALLRPPP